MVKYVVRTEHAREIDRKKYVIREKQVGMGSTACLRVFKELV